MNRNVIKSDLALRAATLLPENLALLDADVNEYIKSGSPQRLCVVTSWQLEDIFTLFDEVAFRVRNINMPDKVEINIFPYDDLLKNIILTDTSNDYYFILYKSDFIPSIIHDLFSIKIAMDAGNYYLFLQRSKCEIDDETGEVDPTGGVRIPNPPPTNPPS